MIYDLRIYDLRLKLPRFIANRTSVNRKVGNFNRKS